MTSLPFIFDFSSAAIATNRPLTGWGTLRFAGLLLGDRAGKPNLGVATGNPFARIPAGALVRLNPNLISGGITRRRLTPPGGATAIRAAGADAFQGVTT